MTTPIKLSKTTTFRRTGPGGEQLLVVPAETTVLYERRETAAAVLHVATLTRDGYLWTSTVTMPKAAAPAAGCPAPKTAALLNQTAEKTAEAVAVIVGKHAKAVDATEKKVRNLDGVVKVLGGRVYTVNYYIPICLNKLIPNPARIFARHGYSLDGSNKLLTEEGLNHPDIQEVFAFWNDFNRKQLENAPALPEGANPLLYASPPVVEFWITENTPEQMAAMRETSRNALARAIREVHTSLITSIDNASETLKKAQEEMGPEPTEKEAAAADDKCNGNIRQAIRAACEKFESCLKGAEMFDDSGSLDDLFDALRDSIQTQAAAANAVLAAKGRKQVELPPTVAPPANAIKVDAHSINPGSIPPAA